jgi:hypothetical protein
MNTWTKTHCLDSKRFPRDKNIMIDGDPVVGENYHVIIGNWNLCYMKSTQILKYVKDWTKHLCVGGHLVLMEPICKQE